MVWNERRGIGHSPSADSIRRESEASLRRLKVDAIDQIYWPDPDRDIEEGWGTWRRSRRNIRNVGVVNFNVVPIPLPPRDRSIFRPAADLSGT
jgi:aryl-alcohol dehydrogenase-like predicted oxidoreductase